MPTYEYQCQHCGYKVDFFQSFKEPSRTVCPHCGYGQLKRMVSSGAGLIFKGSGFYETDYKRKDSDKSNGNHHHVKKESETTEAKTETVAKEDNQRSSGN